MSYSCLIAQKETKDKNVIKCMLTLCDVVPEEFVTQLQENHCMEYQLVIYSITSEPLENQLERISENKKTGYGKNWYEFTDNDLAAIISAYITNGKVVFDYTSISDTMNHTFNLISNGDERVYVAPSLERTNITQVLKPDFTKPKPKSRSHRKKRKDFEIVIGDHTINRDEYRFFLDNWCYIEEKGKTSLPKLLDHFTSYLIETKGCDKEELKDKDILLSGFHKLNLNIVEIKDRLYVPTLHIQK